jgi:hypothetical protein
MIRACSEQSNYQRILINMDYTPCYKQIKLWELKCTDKHQLK